MPQGQALWPGPEEQRAPRGCFYGASRVLRSALLHALGRPSLLSPNQRLPPNFGGQLLAVPVGRRKSEWRQYSLMKAASICFFPSKVDGFHFPLASVEHAQPDRPAAAPRETPRPDEHFHSLKQLRNQLHTSKDGVDE